MTSNASKKPMWVPGEERPLEEQDGVKTPFGTDWAPPAVEAVTYESVATTAAVNQAALDSPDGHRDYQRRRNRHGCPQRLLPRKLQHRHQQSTMLQYHTQQQ